MNFDEIEACFPHGAKQISADTFPIATRKQGGRRVAHYQDVARYLDSFKGE